MPWASLGWAILWGLDTFLMFPNFLRSQVLICLVTREATRICSQVVVAHRFTCGERKIWAKYKKVSEYYENDYLQSFLLLY